MSILLVAAQAAPGIAASAVEPPPEPDPTAEASAAAGAALPDEAGAAAATEPAEQPEPAAPDGTAAQPESGPGAPVEPEAAATHQVIPAAAAAVLTPDPAAPEVLDTTLPRVAVAGQVVSYASGVLAVAVPEAEQEVLPDGRVLESHTRIAGLGNVSGSVLSVLIRPDTVVELQSGPIATVVAGTEVFVSGIQEGPGISADVVLDTDSPAISGVELPDAPAPSAAAPQASVGGPDWYGEFGDAFGPDVAAGADDQPTCSTTQPNAEPCVVEFPGNIGIGDLFTWRSPTFNERFFDVAAFRAYFHSVEVGYSFGGSYSWRFAVDSQQDAPLEVGRPGSTAISVEPLPALETYTSYEAGLGVKADVNFRLCYYVPNVKWEFWESEFIWECDMTSLGEGFGILSETSAAAPMAGQSVDVTPRECLNIDLAMALGSVFKRSIGFEFCLALTINGADLEFAASHGSAWELLTYPGGEYSFTPTARDVQLGLSRFRYNPDIDVDIAIRFYAYSWSWELTQFGFSDYDMRAIPTFQDECPVLAFFPFSFFLMFTLTCGDQPEYIPLAATAAGGRLTASVAEVGVMAPGATYGVEVAGPAGSIATVDVAAGESWASGWLPLGDYTVTEAADSAGVREGAVQQVRLEVDGATVPVSFTNDYSAGKLEVRVVESGDAAPGATYTVEVDGPLGPVASADIPAGGTWLSDWLPLGEYTVAQQAASGTTTYAPGQTVSLAQDGATAVVTVSNAYQQRDEDGDDDEDHSDDRRDSGTDDDSDFPVSGANLARGSLGLGLLLLGVAVTAVSRRHSSADRHR